MSKCRVIVALTIFEAVLALWAVPLTGSAQSRFSFPERASGSSLPVKFKATRDRGLLIDVWVGASGPFVFALDTGAGISIVNRRVTSVARTSITRSRQPLV